MKVTENQLEFNLLPDPKHQHDVKLQDMSESDIHAEDRPNKQPYQVDVAFYEEQK